VKQRVRGGSQKRTITLKGGIQKGGENPTKKFDVYQEPARKSPDGQADKGETQTRGTKKRG